MNTYFTVWHYIATFIILLLLVVAIVATLRQKSLPSKSSFILVYLLAAASLIFITILMLDSLTKKVTLSNLDDYRFLSTEKIIFTGMVRNSGEYPIGEVSVEIKIINQGTGVTTKDPTYQSNAFAELLGDKGLETRPSFLIVTEVVATNLQPGESKKFRIIMPHPPYFKGYTHYARVFGS